MSKNRARVWAQFAAASLAADWLPGGAASRADEMLAEYDKRFPQAVKELVQHNLGRRIEWSIGAMAFQGTIIEEKELCFWVTPDYDTDAVTMVARGDRAKILPNEYLSTAVVPDNFGKTSIGGAIRREESTHGLDEMNIKPSHDSEWNEFIQQHVDPKDWPFAGHASTAISVQHPHEGRVELIPPVNIQINDTEADIPATT